MADKWEAWAIEALAKPWPWNRRKSSFSKKKVFNLAPDENLSMGVAPMIAKKAFEVSVQLEKQGNGILVAQGGDAMDGVSRLKTEFQIFCLSWR